MKERAVTLVCALGALLLFVTMFASGQRGLDAGSGVPRPTTEEQGPNGYRAALEWLTSQHVRTYSLRDRFDQLDREGLSRTGNVLVVTLPATTSFRTEELRALDNWVRAGNTLLVLAALSDEPDWGFAFAGLIPGDLRLLTGLEAQRERHREPVRGAAPFIRPQRAALIPNRQHAYFDEVREAVALSDYPRQLWHLNIPYDGFILALAHDRDSGESVLWARSAGDGRIVVSAFGSLFTNRALGLPDNAQLFANMLGVSLGHGGTVLFDDVHQGLAAAYDPARFYQDPRLYYAIGILAALWLSWVLGSTRLAPPGPAASAPREADLVRTTGGFLARVLRSDAAARRMFALFFARVAGPAPRAEGTGWPPWDVLARQRVASDDLQQLRRWYADACAARRVPLARLHNLMQRISAQRAA
jgi:hypothetical protein